jgi:hypothetical protein
MKKFTTQILTATGFVILMATVGLWSAPRLMAAIKAALVQNIDEPGRNPYQETVTLIDGCPGAPAQCLLDFAAVPAGKRLVVKSISTFVSFSSGTQEQFVELYSVQSRQINQIFAVQFNGPNTYSVHENILAFYEVGSQPRVEVNTSTSTSGATIATLTGYFINLP